MFSPTKRSVALIALCLALIVVGSCSKAAPTQTTSTSEANPDKPNANARIQAQSVFGDVGKSTTVVGMATVDGSSYSFYGTRDNLGGVGRLGSTGTLQWFTSLLYSRRELVPLPPSASVPSGLVVSGKHDSDNDGRSDQGYAWLYSSSGNLLSTLLFSSDTSDVWLNGMVAVSDTAFVVVGGEETPSRTNPFVAVVTLTSAGQLAKGPQVVLTSQATSYYDQVAMHPTGPGGGEVRLYVTAANAPVGTGYHVHQIRAPYPALTPWTVDWSRQITGTAVDLNDLAIYQDRIYVAGSVDDPAKTPAPANGSYWTSGLAARLTLTGDVEWSTIAKLTSHTEAFQGVVPTAGGIFFYGLAARYFQSNNVFGYGWIARVDPATGAVAAHLTFGQDSYGSGFNTAVYNGTTLYCGGFTHYEVSGQGFQGWFSGVDVAGTSPSPVPQRAQAAPLAGPVQDLLRQRGEAR